METRFTPEDIEPKWLENWKATGAFRPCGVGKPFSVVIPPPNVTGALHLGHALNHTIQDVLVRWKRKLGFNTLWVPGTDHAGIATQSVVERKMFENEGKTRHDVGREALIGRIWDWKDEFEARITNQMQTIGSSCEWERQRFTLDDMCAKAVKQTFFNLFSKDLIFRGKRLVNWDTHLQTAVADDEIYHETKQGSMWYFKYQLADGSGELEVATTRPETILGDAAVAVHPNDERYKQFIGKMLKVPFVNREIPVIADGMLVDPEFGTGCVKVTPAHDPNDYATGQRHELPMINIMTETGLVNENGGEFEGMTFPEARKKLVERLKELDLLTKVEDHTLQLGHSDRSKTPVEPFLSDQWFVKMDTLAEDAMGAVTTGDVRIIPDRYQRTYLDWLGEKRDWCISRQLWWGHQIPVWYVGEEVSEAQLQTAFEGQDGVTWKKAEKGGWNLCSLTDISEDAIEGVKLTRDGDVLDTWFSSALWPHSTLGWPEQTQDIKDFFPTSVLVTSRDIISLWVARMVITSQVNLGKVPFPEVFIHPKILDGEGRTMSKSLGNGVDPLDIVAKYGSDALRFTMCGLCTDNQDVRLPVHKEVMEDGTEINSSEKFEQGRNFANKIWNAARFVSSSIQKTTELPDESVLTIEDKWILSKTNSTLKAAEKALEGYKLSEYTQCLYHFAWDDFCSRYLEIVKPRLLNEDSKEKQVVSQVLTHVLDKLLGMLHPVMPFLTEEIHTLLFSEEQNLVTKPWPLVEEKWISASVENDFLKIFEVVESIRAVRGQYSISPSKILSAQIVAEDSELKSSLMRSSALVMTLGRLEELNLEALEPYPVVARRPLSGGELRVNLEGILDLEAEKEKLLKELTRCRSFAQSVQKKLSNSRFVDNAPAQVVQLEKDKLNSQLESEKRLLVALKELGVEA